MALCHSATSIVTTDVPETLEEAVLVRDTVPKDGFSDGAVTRDTSGDLKSRRVVRACTESSRHPWRTHNTNVSRIFYNALKCPLMMWDKA
jgi:hypothetical protein